MKTASSALNEVPGQLNSTLQNLDLGGLETILTQVSTTITVPTNWAVIF